MSGAIWCEECELYECGFCHDFNSEWEYEVEDHAVTCPDREDVTDEDEPP